MAMSNSAMSKAPLFPPATAPTPRLRSCMERLWWRLTQPAPASLLYVTVSLLWLLGEDLLAWANDIRQPAILDLLRVALAIAVSGGLLYWLLRTHADAIARARFAQRQVEDRLRQSLEAMEAQAAERAAERLESQQALELLNAARLQVETALGDSEERFRQLAEHIREVFWVWGVTEQRLLYISPVYEDLWGRPAQHLLERPLDWIDAVHPDDRPRIYAAHFDKSASGMDEEYRIIRPDGTVRWIWDRGFPMHDEYGHVHRVVGLAEDITTRKLAEDQLRRQQTELAKTSRLSLAVELASNLAHDLNQPLAAIVAYTQACLGLLRQDKADPRELTGTLEEVVNQGLRAGSIIRHLRELVQKNPTASQSTLDLNTLIHRVIHYAQLELRQASVTLKLELMDQLPAVLADDLQIQLVVLYLARNAIEAMHESNDGPRLLTLRTTLQDKNTALVTVQDTGPGLSKEAACRLFQPFFSTKPGGMGLGLSVSRSIVESQGGKLWATPHADRGISFHFTLPLYINPFHPSFSPPHA
ncbi:MAG TPA: PAS domain-containing protein [Candidatus Competibacteraceae bacterium]|nr:MAG: PAS domain S-box protein [Candidatus Competibacteraceae bacterium]HOB61094.1 PAS domain-containing protein [Candidatus Competibacteraceae bacterium]HQA26574.1 PAS domain-containing protein [Candidatus Competibacteraceae bacterium]HQD55300.1 PAS domain-containing protein [Candidatus Competibacteraceae bacterium]